MANTFQLTAQLVLAGPDTRPATAKLKRAFGNITIPIKFNKQKYRADLSTMTRQLKTAMTVPVKLSLRDARMQVTKLKRDLKTRLGKTLIPVKLTISKGAETNLGRIATKLTNIGTAALAAKGNVDKLAMSLKAIGTGSYRITAGAQLTKGLKNASVQAGKTKKSIKEVTDTAADFGRVSGLAIRRYAGFTIATTAIFTLGRAITSATTNAVDFEKEMIKVAQINRTAVGSMRNMENQILGLSKAYGIHNSELLSVSKTLAQAGLNARDTADALRAIAKTDLAPTFHDLAKTTEGSIAILNQFGKVAGERIPIDAKNLEKALGSVNAVSKRFAVESDDIISAIRRVGGVFVAASKDIKNSNGAYVSGIEKFQQFIALFTSVRATTRETAETVATGLRTIFTRIQRSRTIDMLKEYGVNLRDVEGNFVGAYEAVQLLGGALNKLNPRDPRFAKIAEELGGFRQIGKTIPLLIQAKRRADALKVAQGGVNSLNEDIKKSLQGLGRQFAQVGEEFNAMIIKFSQTGTFNSIAKSILMIARSFIDLASALRDLAPLLAVVGMFKTMKMGLGVMPGIGKGLKGQSAPILKRATGGPTDLQSGKVNKGGPRGKDRFVAYANGEFVINDKAVTPESLPILNAINSNKMQFAASGGGLGAPPTTDVSLTKNGRYYDNNRKQFTSARAYKRHMQYVTAHKSALAGEVGTRVTSSGQGQAYNTRTGSILGKGQYAYQQQQTIQQQRTQAVQSLAAQKSAALQQMEARNHPRRGMLGGIKHGAGRMIDKSLVGMKNLGHSAGSAHTNFKGLLKKAGPMAGFGVSAMAPGAGELMGGEDTALGAGTSTGMMGAGMGMMLGMGPAGIAATAGLGAVSGAARGDAVATRKMADDKLKESTDALDKALKNIAMGISGSGAKLVAAFRSMTEASTMATRAKREEQGGIFGFIGKQLLGASQSQLIAGGYSGRRRSGRGGGGSGFSGLAGDLSYAGGVLEEEGLVTMIGRTVAGVFGSTKAAELRNASIARVEDKDLAAMQVQDREAGIKATDLYGRALQNRNLTDTANPKNARYNKRLDTEWNQGANVTSQYFKNTKQGKASAVSYALSNLDRTNKNEADKYKDLKDIQAKITAYTDIPGKEKELAYYKQELQFRGEIAATTSQAAKDQAVYATNISKVRVAAIAAAKSTADLVNTFDIMSSRFNSIKTLGGVGKSVVSDIVARSRGGIGGGFSQTNAFSDPNRYTMDALKARSNSMMGANGGTSAMQRAKKTFIDTEDMRRRLPSIMLSAGSDDLTSLDGDNNPVKVLMESMAKGFPHMGDDIRRKMEKILTDKFSSDTGMAKLSDMGAEQLMELAKELFTTLGESSRKVLESALSAQISMLNDYTKSIQAATTMRIQAENKLNQAIWGAQDRRAAFSRKMFNKEDTLGGIAGRRRGRVGTLTGNNNSTMASIMATITSTKQRMAVIKGNPSVASVDEQGKLEKVLSDNKKALEVASDRTQDLALIEGKLLAFQQRRDAASGTFQSLGSMDFKQRRELMGQLGSLNALSQGAQLSDMQLMAAVEGYKYKKSTGLYTQPDQAAALDKERVLINKALYKAYDVPKDQMGIFASALQPAGESPKEQKLAEQFATAVKGAIDGATFKFELHNADITSIRTTAEDIYAAQQKAYALAEKGKREDISAAEKAKVAKAFGTSKASYPRSHLDADGNPYASAKFMTNLDKKHFAYVSPGPDAVGSATPTANPGRAPTTETEAKQERTGDTPHSTVGVVEWAQKAWERISPFHTGGIISGKRGVDQNLAKVSKGEAVIPVDKVKKHPELVNALISGGIPGYANGKNPFSRDAMDTWASGPREVRRRNGQRTGTLGGNDKAFEKAHAKRDAEIETQLLNEYDYNYNTTKKAYNAGNSAALIPGLSGINASNREMLSPNTIRPKKYAGTNSGKLSTSDPTPRGVDKTGRITGSNLSTADQEHNSTIAGMYAAAEIRLQGHAREKERRRKERLQENVDRTQGIYQGTRRNETAATSNRRRFQSANPRGDVTGSSQGAGTLTKYGTPAYTPDDDAAGRPWFNGMGSRREPNEPIVTRNNNTPGMREWHAESKRLARPKLVEDIKARNAERLKRARIKNGKSGTAPTTTRTSKAAETPEARAARVQDVRRRNAQKIADSRGVPLAQVLEEQSNRRAKTPSHPTSDPLRADPFNMTGGVAPSPMAPNAPAAAAPAAPGVAGGAKGVRPRVRSVREPGGGGANSGMSTLATSMDSLNQSVQQLNTTMSALGETSIGLTATHTVNVNMNGAEMLAKIEPVMKQIAIDAVEKGIAARMTDTGETIEKPGGSNIASSTK